MRTTTRVIDGGRVTIPKTVREALGGIEEGDIVEIDVRRVRGG